MKFKIFYLVLISFYLFSLNQTLVIGEEICKVLKISNPSNLTLTDYQVHFVLSNVSTNNLRFVLPSGKILPYWVEHVGNKNPLVWLKVPKLSSQKSIWVYVYCNESHIPEANGDLVFEFFDDFKNLTKTKQKWSIKEKSDDIYSYFNLTVRKHTLNISYLAHNHSAMVTFTPDSVNFGVFHSFSVLYNFGKCTDEYDKYGVEIGGFSVRGPNVTEIIFNQDNYQKNLILEEKRINETLIKREKENFVNVNRFIKLQGYFLPQNFTGKLGNTELFIKVGLSNGNLTLYGNQYNGIPNYKGWFALKKFYIRKYVYPEPTVTVHPPETLSGVNSPQNKTYYTFNDTYTLPININLFFPNQTFTTKIYLDNNLIYNRTFNETAYINFNSTQLPGYHHLSIQTNTSFNRTICYTILGMKKIKKPLFITDTNSTHILALTPLKKPVIVYSEKYGKAINHFIKLYKPSRIFLLGNISIRFKNKTKVQLSDIPKLFFPDKKGIYADTFGKQLIASQIAALLNLPLVFSKPQTSIDFSPNTTEEVEDYYLNLLRQKNKNINYLILTNSSPYASIISAQKQGFIILAPKNASKAKAKLVEKVNKLDNLGFLFKNPQHLFKGNYLLLIGVPSFNLTDPVNDAKDGNTILSDMPYADLDNDTYLDIAIGRLPEDLTLTSLVFSRGYLPTNKKALVASEYLTKNIFSTLVYGGGGMLAGRNVAKALEKQGYHVTCLVEHRTNHRAFLQSLKPYQVGKFIATYVGVKRLAEKFVSKTFSTVLGNLILGLQGLSYANEALESYYEYDWSSFGRNYESALAYIGKLPKDKKLTLTDAINIAKLLWPNSWPKLTPTNLKREMKDASVIYYEGLGNESLWILPTNFEESNDVISYQFWAQQLANLEYDGSRVFKPDDIPELNARLVWSNADFSARSELKNKFLEKDVASFIGPYALNYYPYSGEIDSRFFSAGDTVGTAFVRAVNTFRSDWFTWDPFHVTTPGIKEKELLEYFVFGDPSLPKKGRIENPYVSEELTCANYCKLKVKTKTKYRVKNHTVQVDNSDGNLLEPDQPITPVKRFTYYLPENATINETDIKVNLTTENLGNITLPKVNFISHSGIKLNLTNETTKYKHHRKHKRHYRVNIRKTFDGRKQVEVIVPLLWINETNNTTSIVKQVNISLKYKTPLDFAIKVRNIKLGETLLINFTIFSHIADNTTLLVEISNQTHTFSFNYTFKVFEGNKTLKYNFTPEAPGRYRVKAVLQKHDPLTIGPRVVYFDVEQPCVPKIRINEIMYNPKGSDIGREWIELYNYGDCSISLEGWYFTDKTGNHKLKLTQGSWILQPKDFAIISNNATQFLFEHRNFDKTIFQASFSLLNSGEEIALKDDSKNVVNEVNYTSTIGANGNGKTLEFKDGKWVESYLGGGTPGGPNNDMPFQKTEQIIPKSLSMSSSMSLSKSTNETSVTNESSKMTHSNGKSKTRQKSQNNTETKITQVTTTKNITKTNKNYPTGGFILPLNTSILTILFSSLTGLLFFLFKFFNLRNRIKI